jgi:hypothetical protein
MSSQRFNEFKSIEKLNNDTDDELEPDNIKRMKQFKFADLIFLIVIYIYIIVYELHYFNSKIRADRLYGCIYLSIQRM